MSKKKKKEKMWEEVKVKKNKKNKKRGGDCMLGMQLRIGGLNLHKVQNGGVKPRGGMWTATWIEGERKSSWIEFCEVEEFQLPEDGIWRGYLLKPNSDARIYTIGSSKDLKRITKKYSYSGRIDFEKASKDYDAVHVTWKGIRELYDELYGWDMESTVWFREAYTVVEEVELEVRERKYGIQDRDIVDNVHYKKYTLKRGMVGTYRWKYKDTTRRPYYTNALFVMHLTKVVYRCIDVEVTCTKSESIEIVAGNRHGWSRDQIWSLRVLAKVEDNN